MKIKFIEYLRVGTTWMPTGAYFTLDPGPSELEITKKFEWRVRGYRTSWPRARARTRPTGIITMTGKLPKATAEQLQRAAIVGLFNPDFTGRKWRIVNSLDNSPILGNGDSGTATDGSANTIVDSAKDWSILSFSGQPIELLSGTGAPQSKMVISNDETTITVNSNWSTNPAAGTTYIVGHMFCVITEIKEKWKEGYRMGAAYGSDHALEYTLTMELCRLQD